MRWPRAGIAVLAMAITACTVAETRTPGDGSAAAAPPSGLPSASSIAEQSPAAVAAPVEIVVVGDSLSLGDSTAFTADGLGEGSFVYWALGEDVRFVGGDAIPGATSTRMRDRLLKGSLVIPACDVLVLALGTNDLGFGVAFDDTSQALVSLAEGGAAPRTMLLAIPPYGREDQPPSVSYNQRLAMLASEQGWEFVDAAVPARDGGGWAEGMTSDGIHYSGDVVRLVGEVLADALVSSPG
ncbi:SGNH/GDSL hydrolase family protein [Demequina subtropica]|uniref:SGNH/GDSL hydrolase family protein n=1 Tax=Demequina subtropica TaxID=1638989 RepID=UPI0007823FB4|nr:SGNH/GDSL hydrolase family protein [Demequina subtropica]